MLRTGQAVQLEEEAANFRGQTGVSRPWPPQGSTAENKALTLGPRLQGPFPVPTLVKHMETENAGVFWCWELRGDFLSKHSGSLVNETKAGAAVPGEA